ncbi:MAG: RNA-binding S4 domain-containing protein [Opitutus sp.]
MRAPPRKTSRKPTPAPAATPSARVVTVRAQPIELCQLLKFAGLSESGGQAKQTIAEGAVLLNGVVETQKRKKVMAGDKVTLGAETIEVQLS